MKLLTVILAAAFQVMIVAQTSNASTAESSNSSCEVIEGDQDTVLKCYQQEYQEKFIANERRQKDAISRAKELLLETLEQDRKSAAADKFVELMRGISKTVSSNRRAAAHDCVRFAAKLKSQETSAIAAVNCKSSHEVKLDQELRRFELRLETLSMRAKK